jgi:hypothetical protein
VVSRFRFGRSRLGVVFSAQRRIRVFWQIFSWLYRSLQANSGIFMRVRFNDLMSVTMKSGPVFWYVPPCSSVSLLTFRRGVFSTCHLPYSLIPKTETVTDLLLPCGWNHGTKLCRVTRVKKRTNVARTRAQQREIYRLITRPPTITTTSISMGAQTSQSDEVRGPARCNL